MRNCQFLLCAFLCETDSYFAPQLLEDLTADKIQKPATNARYETMHFSLACPTLPVPSLQRLTGTTFVSPHLCPAPARASASFCLCFGPFPTKNTMSVHRDVQQGLLIRWPAQPTELLSNVSANLPWDLTAASSWSLHPFLWEPVNHERMVGAIQGLFTSQECSSSYCGPQDQFGLDTHCLTPEYMCSVSAGDN